MHVTTYLPFLLQRSQLGVHLPVGVAAGPGAPVGVSALSFFFASMTGFSNWVFWLMWLHKGGKNIKEGPGADKFICDHLQWINIRMYLSQHSEICNTYVELCSSFTHISCFKFCHCLTLQSYRNSCSRLLILFLSIMQNSDLTVRPETTQNHRHAARWTRRLPWCNMQKDKVALSLFLLHIFKHMKEWMKTWRNLSQRRRGPGS